MLLLRPKNLRRLKPPPVPAADDASASFETGAEFADAERALVNCEVGRDDGIGSDDTEAELLSSAAGCGGSEVDKAGGGSIGFLQVAERRRVWTLGGSGCLDDEPASEEAVLPFLNMMAAPSELTRTRMPLLEGGCSAEAEDTAGGAAEAEGDSGMAMVRTGRPKLDAAPPDVCLEVSVMVCSGCQEGGTMQASREMKPDCRDDQMERRDIGPVMQRPRVGDEIRIPNPELRADAQRDQTTVTRITRSVRKCRSW